jgi:hypothetical protein
MRKKSRKTGTQYIINITSDVVASEREGRGRGKALNKSILDANLCTYTMRKIFLLSTEKENLYIQFLSLFSYAFHEIISYFPC